MNYLITFYESDLKKSRWRLVAILDFGTSNCKLHAVLGSACKQTYQETHFYHSVKFISKVRFSICRLAAMLDLW